MPTKVLRVFYTLRHLKLKQLFFYIIRRKLPEKFVRLRLPTKLRSTLILEPPIPFNEEKITPYGFYFLNKARQFVKANMNWCPSNEQRLWQYNLHYFDYLRSRQREIEEKKALINHWIENNPQGSKPGWEPFTTSLRIVNWIFYLQQNQIFHDQTIINSLYLQVLWLEKNDERHILANHYFENLKALIFASAFFVGADAQRWLKHTSHELQTQLVEQTLSDGGHYERTPQYHALMLENYLDLFNLVKNNQSLFDCKLMQLLEITIKNGINYLSNIVYYDESLPLFNDTANNIAPKFRQLNQYTNSLIAYKADIHRNAHIFQAHESGLYGYYHQKDAFIIDCGDIGPRYQPGHTHCDMLSYELMLNGQKLIVDTGVSEYEPGHFRHYLRSTQAHNTVSVDNGEQSEIWGEFRVARRAKKHTAGITREYNNVKFTGCFTGFFKIKGNIMHQRNVNLCLTNDYISELKVEDIISGAGNHKLDSRLYFHPVVILKQQSYSIVNIFIDKTMVAIVEILSSHQCKIEKGFYCSEFGKKQENQCLCISSQENLPAHISYKLTKV